MMFQTHFSSFSKILMLNTEDFKYSLLIKNDVSLMHHKIKRVIYKMTLNKTLKHTEYTNKIMRRLVDDMSEQIHSLFERCLQKKIQSTQFKSIVTIVMQKSNKKNYFNAKTYRSIVLLNMLSKILKFIVFKRLQNVIKACNSILNTQMKVHKHKSTDTTLQLITEKIHTVWSNMRRRVVSLLSLNEENAFDNVMHSRLLHDMKKRKVFRLLLEFVKNFLKDQCITITIDDYMMMKCSVNVDISQNSSLSSILYLFYNANLLEACDDIKLRTNFTDFVNDVNILTYKEFIKCNCRVFSEIYDKCEQWLKMHDIKFLMTKHELIHFTRTFKWFNMKVDVKLIKHQINLKSNIRILRVQLNFKLKWTTYMHHVKAKLVIKQKIMQTIIKFTWDSSMMTSKQIYFVMMRSLLSHEVIIWYTSQRVKDHWKSLNVKLRSMQERTLRQIIDIYHATSTKTLQMKINITLIDIHLWKLIQKSITNMNSWKLSEVIKMTVRWICNNLTFKRDQKSKLRKTFLQLKRKWIKETFRQMKMNRSHFYTAILWSESSKIVIVANKRMLIKQHNFNIFASKQRVYLNDSDSRNNVTVIVMRINWELDKRLRELTLVITHHDELKELIARTKHLADVTTANQECHEKIYKVYSDSQTFLKTVKVIISTKD